MANLLDRFNIDVVGSSAVISDYMASITPKGDFKRITEFDAILNSWNNILITPTRTYFFDPEYGSELYKKVFDPADELTMEDIEDEVVDKLMYYDNRAYIDSIKIEFATNKKGFNISVYASYKGDKKELSVFIGEDIFNDFLRNT